MRPHIADMHRGVPEKEHPSDDAQGFWTCVGRKPKRVVNVEFQSAGQGGIAIVRTELWR